VVDFSHRVMGPAPRVETAGSRLGSTPQALARDRLGVPAVLAFFLHLGVHHPDDGMRRGSPDRVRGHRPEFWSPPSHPCVTGDPQESDPSPSTHAHAVCLDPVRS
jgi:hypothetical protein